MGKNKAHNRKKEAFFEKSETPISQTKDILGYKPPQNLYFIQYIYSFSMPYFEDWQIAWVCNRLHLENKFFQRKERNMWDIYS